MIVISDCDCKHTVVQWEKNKTYQLRIARQGNVNVNEDKLNYSMDFPS